MEQRKQIFLLTPRVSGFKSHSDHLTQAQVAQARLGTVNMTYYKSLYGNITVVQNSSK